jgi:vacuolar-type H+-ATPase subunit H
MQEIFKEVLTKEDEAALIVKEASEKALKITSEAETFYQDRVKAAREKSRKTLTAMREQIQNEQELKVQEVLNDYEKKWVELQKQGERKVADLAVKLARITEAT